ncbi:MAG: FmdB family zinc ribbon protein [Spirochaetota bacterium]
MPTYEYRCNECEELFEFFQKITDEPLKTCPACGGELVRLISGGMGVIFKGHGFYTTDYKNSSNNFSKPKKDSDNLEKESIGKDGFSEKSNKKEKDYSKN